MNDYVQISGGPGALAFSATVSGSGNAERTDHYTFTGSLSGTTIAGSLSWQTQSQTSANGSTFNGTGSLTMAVTLQR